MLYLLDLLVGLGQEGLGLGEQTRLEVSLGKGLRSGGGDGGMGGVRMMASMLNLKEFSLQTVLSGSELVLQMSQLGGVSLGFNFSDQLLDGGLLVLHNSHLVGAVGGLQLKREMKCQDSVSKLFKKAFSIYLLDLLVGLGEQGFGLGKQTRLQITLGKGLGSSGGNGGVRGVRVVAGVLNLEQLSLQAVLGGGQLVLEVGQLGSVSLGLNFSDQLLDGGLLVLHHGHLVGAVGSLQLKR